jgi:phosphotransacetylase
MSLPSFDDLMGEADRRAPRAPVVAVGGANPTVIAAMKDATARGWVRATLAVGHDSAHVLGTTVEGLDVLVNDDPAAVAVEVVRSGRAAVLMKGQVATPALMKAVLDPERGLRTGRVIGQVVLMEIPRDGRRILMADTGVTIAPDLEQKADLLRSVLEIARALGVERPKVAAVAASETAKASMPGTLDAAELQRLAGSGTFGPCDVQGPLSFDLAYAADAADMKRIGGPVVGKADALLFPDLTSANLTVKAIMYTADCRFGGVLCGTACPVAFMSRADSVETRLRSLALALKLISGTRAAP